MTFDLQQTLYSSSNFFKFSINNLEGIIKGLNKDYNHIKFSRDKFCAYMPKYVFDL